MTRSVPATADVVIIGGGIVGCSVAYHLAHRGVARVLLLERRQLTCGTTWHAAGLIGQLRATRRLTELALYGIRLYERLEDETGQATGFKRNGSISVATSDERMEELERGASMARALGIDADRVSPAEIGTLSPLVHTRDLKGGIHFPADGQINPVDTTMALARGARTLGATILENVEVIAVLSERGRVTGARTKSGEVSAPVVVNCTGMWARGLGHSCGVNIPLHACEHFYVITEPIARLPKNLPVLRDLDGCAYYKEEAGKLLIGAFEPVAKPWGMDGIGEDFCFTELPEDLDHFAPVLEGAVQRVPVLATTGIQTFFNGPESFTPDDNYLLGEAPELGNFFVAAGFNSVGIQSAAGAGKLLAEWIADGRPPADIWDVDIRRTFPFQSERSYIEQRVSETLGLLYAPHWPHRQYETSRNVRMSPLHDDLAAAGACFGSVAGWERANWFAPPGSEAIYRYSYRRSNYFEPWRAEHRAVRESVALFDQSSFAKFEVRGADACHFLQRICSNDIDREPGRVVYTQWLNELGGIEADVTVTRLDADAFRVITSPATARRDWTWLQMHVHPDERCEMTDVTDRYAVLSVMGPGSRDLLASLSGENWSNAAFAFATAARVTIAGTEALAQRISYVGELGWELYVPVGSAQALFEAIRDAGRHHGLRLAGYHALDSCRLEKGYRSWGHDINDLDTPAEAGLGFATAINKAVEFIGREAVQKQRAGEVRRRLLCLRLRDPEPLLYHDEPVYRNGRHAGFVTSASYGHTLECAVGLGFVHAEEAIDAAFVQSGDYEIEIAGQRHAAAASLTPWYDPTGERIRS